MEWTKLVICVMVVIAVAQMTIAKPTKKAKKVKKPKLNLKTLAAKMALLAGKLDNIETKVNRIDIANGRFEDDAPCPVKKTNGFFLSEQTRSCYRMEPSTLMMNWTQGQDHCNGLHPKAHLVAMETIEEYQYLKAKWYNECGISSVSRFWTDGSKLGEDDTWYWVTSNTSLDQGYTNWIPNTTHDDERFNCMAVYANEGYAMGDVACWAPHVVTCEIEL